MPTETVVVCTSREGADANVGTATYPVTKIHEVNRLVPFSYSRKLAGHRVKTSVANRVIIRAFKVIIKDASQVVVTAE